MPPTLVRLRHPPARATLPSTRLAMVCLHQPPSWCVAAGRATPPGSAAAGSTPSKSLVLGSLRPRATPFKSNTMDAASAFPVSTDPTRIEHLLPRGIDPARAYEGGPYPRIPRLDLLGGAPDLRVHVAH
jgi:hypothetical protein